MHVLEIIQVLPNLYFCNTLAIYVKNHHFVLLYLNMSNN